MNGENFTLITGASMGIGKAFSNACAARGMNLVLVALPDGELAAVQKEILATWEVKVLVFTIDLTEEDAVKRLYDFCIEMDLTIDVLINNAGIGTGGRFENIGLEKQLKVIDLNNKVLVRMCHYFLPLLQKQDKAYILNMSSMEANLPLPYKAVYTGSKNFVYAFSLALREELKRGPVCVSVVCPGPVVTNAEGLERMKAHGSRAKLVVLMPDEVAEIGLKCLLKGKTIIIPGKINWVLVKLSRLFPTATKMRLLERLFRVYNTH
ncbi:SDR family NAD(P)-dependent oxidoreductase [Cyclobacterium qasimii]|uniref:Short-chain dehydrogenase n=2 Tax=Cyclobacterium qasimii TaxID=1350429 RepID=A0A512C6W4_9BACT|nr:SDR family NAD(P)-dependent oxidoreductase [Cyclobacterium qasimii]EPR68156.1 putative short-chain dehydrogenase [Cyclobacterium qasimii M12-11B]GEO19956.1 short-chain dehydrogenase [Cyclobacterium qasimii]